MHRFSHEQQILDEIEQEFLETDPDLAEQLGGGSLAARCRRRLAAAMVGVLVGTAGMIVALYQERPLSVALVALAMVVVSALWLGYILDDLGRIGRQAQYRAVRVAVDRWWRSVLDGHSSDSAP